MGVSAHHRLVTDHSGIVDNVGLEVLDTAECLRLLELGGVGRVAIAGDPPVVRPVNFVLDEGRIVVRTGSGSLWRAASERRLVTFEIDEARNVDHRGWSVLASGPLHQLEADGETMALPLRAWAPRGRDRFVAIDIVSLSGRRLTGRP
jgi:nitroimidazol reductase NimA-like FMN-containing flavoprotein (pyridoxamine 5'-phosphate oxidase superfamily)